MTDEKDPLAEEKDRLLQAALANVPFDGWSDASLEAAARSIGMDPAEILLCFPGGLRDVLAHFSDWADRGMVAEIHAAGSAFKEMKVREKIAFAVRARLTFLEPYKEAVRLMTAHVALPVNTAFGARLVWKTADTMWYEAGDTATDFNHYTKRGLLSGVQASTVLFWLGDSSDGHERTWAFLDRRIENVLAIGMRIGKFGKLGGRMPDPGAIFRKSPFARRGKGGRQGETGPSATVH